MADKQIISRESIKELAKKLKETFATQTEVDTLKTSVGEAVKGAKYNRDANTIELYTDKAMTAPAAFTLNLPKELFLDQTKTEFVGTMTWSDEKYPGSTNPELDSKPVMVLCVKGEEKDSYSFIDMSTLVDTYKAKAGDGTATVTVSGYEISVNVNISKEADNALEKKSDGLYVPKPATVDVSGKVDKVAEAVENNLVSFGAGGTIADSGIAKADVLTAADIQDFSEEEIRELFGE